MQVYRDHLKRQVHLSKTPSRIVSLVPSQTELLVDLGLRDAIVGITKFCVKPKGLRREKQVVGGTKQVHLDKIQALQPDIILCNKEENTKEMVTALEAIAPVWVSVVKTIPDALQLITDFGALFQQEENAENLRDKITKAYLSLIEHTAANRKKKVAYVIWKSPWMLAGKDTFIDAMLHAQGMENCVDADAGRYPEVTMETFGQADVIMLSSEPFPFKEEDAHHFRKQFPSAKVLLVDGAMYSWYGSRLVYAFPYLEQLRKAL